jgi:hypothetical protein
MPRLAEYVSGAVPTFWNEYVLVEDGALPQ